MKRIKVAILGCTGMLGSITLDSFVKSNNFDIIATYRDDAGLKSFLSNYKDVKFRKLDAQTASPEQIAKVISGADWVVNSIGVIKPYIHDDDAEESRRAIQINSIFPYNLSLAAKKEKAKVIQIATDCVYSGKEGKYKEDASHDAIDVYGKTKSLGEAYLDNMLHIRCSIIGPELKGHLSLLDWFLGNPNGSELNGFTNHDWNGVTTLHFARIAMGIIKNGIKIDHLQHIIPGNSITKAKLLKTFVKEFKRGDIKVNDIQAPTVIDRTLATNNKDLNKKIWLAAGYKTPPTIEKMVAELAEYVFLGKRNNQ